MLSSSPVVVMVVVVPSPACKVVSSVEIIALSRVSVSCLMLLWGWSAVEVIA